MRFLFWAGFPPQPERSLDRGSRHSDFCSSRQGRRGHETVRDIVHHHAKTFQGSHPQQCHVARFGKDNFVGGLITLGAQNGIANIPLNGLLRGSVERSLASRRNADFGENV